MGISRDVADGVVSALNADPLANFGVTFTAKRTWVAKTWLLKQLDVLRVDVVATAIPEVEQVTRGGDVMYFVAVQVGLRKTFERDEDGRLCGDLEQRLRPDPNDEPLRAGCPLQQWQYAQHRLESDLLRPRSQGPQRVHRHGLLVVLGGGFVGLSQHLGWNLRCRPGRRRQRGRRAVNHDGL